MPQLQRPAIQPKHPIERYPCPKCGWYMIIPRIEPDESGYSLHTFECSKCGNSGFARNILGRRKSALIWCTQIGRHARDRRPFEQF
jgi:predicted RNA-binding Zn-ribbon protein involved in translation (DUF1610 family)